MLQVAQDPLADTFSPVTSVLSLPNAEIYANLNPKCPESAKYAAVSAAQQINLNVHLVCVGCKDPVPTIIEDWKQGDLICANCGTVFNGRLIDNRREWRTFESHADGNSGFGDPSRVGASTNKLLPGSLQLETTIGDQCGKAGGGGSGHGTGGSRDLQRTHAKTSTNRNSLALTDGYRRINNLGDRLNLGSGNEAATGKHYLHKMAVAGMAINRKLDMYCAAALLIGCRASGINFSADEIAATVNATGFDLMQIVKVVNPKVGNIQRKSTIDEGARASSALDLPAVAAAMVTHLCQEAKNHVNLGSRKPGTVRGAALYFVSHLIGHPRKLADIAAHVKLTAPTVRGAYKILYANREVFMSNMMRAYDLANLPRS